MLVKVEISSDGSLEAFDRTEGSEVAGAAAQAGTVLVAHLLELLVTFIGAPLTLRLVRDAWPDASSPDASLNQLDSGAEEKP